MGIVILFLFVLFVIFILSPVFRIWWALRKARKQARDFFGPKSKTEGYSGSGNARETHYHRRRGKIIDPDVGEYVEFEEISTFSQTSESYDGDATVKYETEEQITDVEWEDIR